MLLRPLLFFAGKGGVGKTTLATAMAARLAADGARTLLVSTDPAHSTADLLGRPLGDAPVAVAAGLEALEVDAEAEARRYVERIKADARAALSREVRATVERHLDLAVTSPGTVESALLDRIAALVADCGHRYDRIVFDTAPTGHTLRLLALPGQMTGLVEELMRRRERGRAVERMAAGVAGPDQRPAGDDPVVRRLRRRRALLAGLHDRLRRDASVLLVLVPERLAIEETARTLPTLSSAGLDVAAVVVNRVLPDAEPGAFLRLRLGEQERALDQIRRRFAGHPLVTVSHAAREIVTAQDLAGIAAQLVNRDPHLPTGAAGF